VRWINGSLLLVAAATLFAGCDDPTAFDFNPILMTDTVAVAAPLPQNVTLPTALDVTGDGFGSIRGGRFPERVPHEWDFAVRIREGQIVLIPSRALGEESRSAITPALEGETFEGLREAPTGTNFSMERAVPMRVGEVYAARSREFAAGGFFGAGCVQYAKIQPLEVDTANGRVRLRITTNERCGDPRLVPVD